MTDAFDASWVAEWTKWRQADEQTARAIGHELRDVVESQAWSMLSVDERRARIEAALSLLRKRLGVVRETPVEWVESDDPGLEYDPGTGAIRIPNHHLGCDDPGQLIRGLAEEMRHAWQFDVIEGHSLHPLGPMAKNQLTDAFRNYTSTDQAAYNANELEMDATDFAFNVGTGYTSDGP